MATPIDVRAVQETIRKLQRILEFAEEFGNDPEYAHLLAEFTQKNGSAPKPAPVAVSRQMDSSESGNVPSSALPRGYFLRGVEAAVVATADEFTTDDIEKHLRSAGVQIRSQNPNIAINEALRTLEGRGVVAVTRRRGARGRLIWRKLSSAEESRTA